MHLFFVSYISKERMLDIGYRISVHFGLKSEVIDSTALGDSQFLDNDYMDKKLTVNKQNWLYA